MTRPASRIRLASVASSALTATALLLCVTPAPARSQYSADASLKRARATVAAVALMLPVGSEHDVAGYEGTAWLLGHALAAQANAALTGVPARVGVEVGRASTTFTLTAVPDARARAWATVENVLFREPLDAAGVEAVRERLSEQLVFRAGSPVVDFRREAIAMLAEPGHAWARALTGTTESVGTVGVRQAELLRSEGYTPAAATLAVVGPDANAPVADSVPAAPPRAVAGPAWRVGTRVALVQEVTSAWIAVAYPAPSGSSRTALEFLAHLARETLDPVPPDPDRYAVDVVIVDAPGGPVLLIEAAVLPEAADRWETTIVERMDRLRAASPQGDFFTWARRRFRTERLLAEGAPEIAAARMAADLARDGAPRVLIDEIEALTASDAAQALRALGEPRIFRLGPDLGLPPR